MQTECREINLEVQPDGSEDWIVTDDNGEVFRYTNVRLVSERPENAMCEWTFSAKGKKERE